MNDVSLNNGQLSRQMTEWGLTAVRVFAEEAAARSRDRTGITRTRPHSASQDYYSAPGMLRESIYSSAHVDVIGPVGKVHYITPLGWFRNMSGRGHAAYALSPESGRIPYYRRLKSGRRVLRYRRVKASAALFGRGRGDWRSIQKAMESMDGAHVGPHGVTG
jgi:hypothetical protein